MVISAEPHPPADPVAGGGGGEGAPEGVVEEASTNAARQQQAAVTSSFPSLKAWGSNRVLRCAPVSRGGDAIARRSSAEKLDEVREDLLLHLREVPVPGGTNADAPADAAEAEVAAGASRPWKLRTRRRRPAATSPAAVSASSPQPSERRASRARAEALDRPRFSVTLSSEEIEEDVYAFTGARPRRRPRRRPRPVQKQLDLLLPGAWLSEITAETYRVPDDR